MAEPTGDRLEADLNSTAFAAGVNSGFWRLVERCDSVVYVECEARDGHSYLLELRCDRYGDEPCLGRFVDSESRECVPSAWPTGNDTLAGWLKWRPGDLFVCWPGDRAGIAHHPEWRAQEYWRSEENQIVQYLEFVRRLLNLPGKGYASRAVQ